VISRSALNVGRAALFALATSLCACALQAGTAVHFPRPADDAVPLALELGVKLKPERRSGMYGSLDAVFAKPSETQQFGVREAALGAGYHLAWKALGIELGPRLGVGEPAFRAFPGTGFHVAGDLTLLFRLYGKADQLVGFIPLGATIDLALFGRGGVWARPYQGHIAEIGAGVVGLGVRLGLISSVSDLRRRDWEGP
jgi:hypothetical protein